MLTAVLVWQTPHLLEIGFAQYESRGYVARPPPLSPPSPTLDRPAAAAAGISGPAAADAPAAAALGGVDTGSILMSETTKAWSQSRWCTKAYLSRKMVGTVPGVGVYGEKSRRGVIAVDDMEVRNSTLETSDSCKVGRGRRGETYMHEGGKEGCKNGGVTMKPVSQRRGMEHPRRCCLAVWTFGVVCKLDATTIPSLFLHVKASRALDGNYWKRC